jgi:hypothetical protein
MVDFRIVETDGPTLMLEVILPRTRLEVVTSVRLDGNCLVLYDLHVDGPGAHSLGVAEVRGLVRKAMEAYDVARVEIHGFERSTGANPGRKPRVLRFARR